MQTNQDRYGVMGNPIAHSLSPRIHSCFAHQTQQALVYEKILVPLDKFEAAIKTFYRQGGKGLNITLPFKQQAFAIATQRRPHAKLAQAANTLTFDRAGQILADNTDGIGLVRDLRKNHAIELKNQRILILGASGGARGVIGPLLKQDPRYLHIANRTEEKAAQLAKHFSSLGQVTASGLQNLGPRKFDLLINATSASLRGELLPIPTTLLTEACCCYDLVYATKPTVFLQWASQQGAAKSIDGLGMLVEQAAESFYLWRNVRPQTQGVLTQIRLQLSKA